MHSHSDLYYPLDHFSPPDKKEKLTLRECKVSKLQWELEKHTVRKNAEKISKLLESNGFTYFQKLLEAKINEISSINGIGPKSMEIIKKVRSTYGIKEEK